MLREQPSALKDPWVWGRTGRAEGEADVMHETRAPRGCTAFTAPGNLPRTAWWPALLYFLLFLSVALSITKPF